MLTDKEAASAKKWATRILGDHGINERFMVRVHAFKDSHLAVYRALSQFSSSGPIIWLPPDLDMMMLREGIPRDLIVEVATDSILHEFGHVIAEWGKKRDAPLLALIEQDWPDEEDFAEEFARRLSGRSYADMASINAIISRYTQAVTSI